MTRSQSGVILPYLASQIDQDGSLLAALPLWVQFNYLSTKCNSHYTHISCPPTWCKWLTHPSLLVAFLDPKFLHQTFRCMVACNPQISSLPLVLFYYTPQQFFRKLRKIQVIPSQLWKAEQSLGASASSCQSFSVQDLKWQALNQKIGD